MDPRTGIPGANPEANTLFRGATPQRQCQFVISPAFSTTYAVWLSQYGNAGHATVSVSVLNEDGLPAKLVAPIDANMAKRLARMCQVTLPVLQTTCVELGRDGTWYHAAHYVPDNGYVGVSFWSPKEGTLGRAFVNIAEALRDYTTAPEALRREQWIRVNDAENKLMTILEEP